MIGVGDVSATGGVTMSGPGDPEERERVPGVLGTGELGPGDPGTGAVTLGGKGREHLFF